MSKGARGPKARTITLSKEQQTLLETIASSRQSPYSQVIRSQIILQAAGGERNQAIARELKVHVDMVRRWRDRWVEAEGRLAIIESEDEGPGLSQAIATLLADAPRSGTPAKFSAEEICQIIAVACEVPEDSGRPITHWTPTELAHEVVQRQIVASISPRQVGRFLKGERPQAPPEPLLAQ